MQSLKYRNQKVEIDGHTFDSKAEGRRYLSLKLLERGNRIEGLELQPSYPLYSRTGAKIGKYVGDFKYTELGDSGQPLGVVCEDVKGMPTPVYRWKIKHAKADYPSIEFREIKA